MKLSKLAFENVKKSYKDYFIYFLTLMFSVCLFYTFNSFSSQKNIMELSESQAMSLQTFKVVDGQREGILFRFHGSKESAVGSFLKTDKLEHTKTFQG